jgi:hypothetical protein
MSNRRLTSILKLSLLSSAKALLVNANIELNNESFKILVNLRLDISSSPLLFNDLLAFFTNL